MRNKNDFSVLQLMSRVVLWIFVQFFLFFFFFFLFALLYIAATTYRKHFGGFLLVEVAIQGSFGLDVVTVVVVAAADVAVAAAAALVVVFVVVII